MLRGFRWQLLALILGVALLGSVLAYRATITPPDVHVTPVVPNDTAGTPVPIAESLTGAPPLPTEAPTDAADPAPILVSQGSVGSDHYREALIGSVQRLNPLFSGLNPIDRDITSLIFEGLTRIDAFGQPVPALAASWTISPDGLEYIVTLRDDVLWQDGTPFTAADVLYTMGVLRDPRFPGAPELGAFWRTIETESLGEDLVRFRLAQPLGAFLDRLAIGILPEHALRGTGAEALSNHPFNVTPIGTGPYQLGRLIAPDGVTPRAVELVAAPTYAARAEADGQPFALRRLTFVLYDDFATATAALASGEVDGLAARDRDERGPLFDLAFSQNITLINGVEPTVGMIIYNWERETTPYFREQRFRIALETGLDRAAAIERALPNLALRTDSPLIPRSWAFAPDVSLPAYNPTTAQNLLVTAAERMERMRPSDAPTPDPAATATPEGDPLFSFSILTPNTPSLVRLANEIATQWSQLCLRVTVEIVDLALYQERLRSHDFDAVVVEYGFSGSADPDIYAFWHEGQYPDGENYGGVSDRRISEILERARREPFNINRIPDYQTFQREFIDRAIALPIYNPLFTYAFSPTVRGVQLGYLATASSRFESIGAWSIAR